MRSLFHRTEQAMKMIGLPGHMVFGREEVVMNTTSTLVKRSLGWSIVTSVLMIVAGILAMVVPPAAGIAVTVFIGWLVVFSSQMHFVYAWHARGAGGVIWEMFVGIAYLFVGLYMLFHPLRGMVSLTLALSIYLLAESILEFIMAARLRPQPGSGWLFVDGIITLILAVMIWRTWPSSTAWVLGILVGISMFFSGISRLMISLAARKLLARTA
jgi:uncharacterized membrane protein HdeD (DUF308 family)